MLYFFSFFSRFFLLQKILGDVLSSTEDSTELSKVSQDTVGLLDTLAATVAARRKDSMEIQADISSGTVIPIF